MSALSADPNGENLQAVDDDGSKMSASAGVSDSGTRFRTNFLRMPQEPCGNGSGGVGGWVAPPKTRGMLDMEAQTKEAREAREVTEVTEAREARKFIEKNAAEKPSGDTVLCSSGKILEKQKALEKITNAMRRRKEKAHAAKSLISLRSQEGYLAPFNPTDAEALASMVWSRLDLQESDKFYDLGCGDGRVLVTALCNSKAKGVGIEYDPVIAERARRKIAESGLSERAEVIVGDILAADISSATVIFCYLVPSGLTKILEMLNTAVGGPDGNCRYVITNMFTVPGWKPLQVFEYSSSLKVYLYDKTSLPGV